ncbi:PHD finger protein 7-like [Cyanocitta cristata]
MKEEPYILGPIKPVKVTWQEDPRFQDSSSESDDEPEPSEIGKDREIRGGRAPGEDRGVSAQGLIADRKMAEGKQEAPDAKEPACLLCRRAEADPDICGDKWEKHGLCAHVFCLKFASLIFQQDNGRMGLKGFRPRDIQLAVSRAAQQHCCVCGETGATIMCCQEDCDRWFHLPCAKEGHCVTKYITPYRSYCPEHSPEQDVTVIPEPGTECPICMEPVEERKSYTTLVCPACKRAWFHRDCIQGQALRAGALYFQCPLCRDDDEFSVQMFIMGIRIPFREPTWEDNDAFAELGDRHSRCNARKCLYPGGREEAEEEG